MKSENEINKIDSTFIDLNQIFLTYTYDSLCTYMLLLLSSFDVRGRAFEKALYWSDTNSFGPRAYFITNQQPAKLTVENIQLDDEGVSK